MSIPWFCNHAAGVLMVLLVGYPLPHFLKYVLCNGSDLKGWMLSQLQHSFPPPLTSQWTQNSHSLAPWASVWRSASLIKKIWLLWRNPQEPQSSQWRSVCASWRTRTDFRPLQVCPVHGVEPLNLLVRGVCVFTLWSFVLCVSLKKFEFLPFVTKHICPCSRKQTCINIKITAFFGGRGGKKLCTLHWESKYYIQNKIVLHSSVVKV